MNTNMCIKSLTKYLKKLNEKYLKILLIISKFNRKKIEKSEL